MTRGRSRSSILTTHRPPAARANNHEPAAATRLPRCSGPVGDGAKRPVMRALRPAKRGEGAAQRRMRGPHPALRATLSRKRERDPREFSPLPPFLHVHVHEVHLLPNVVDIPSRELREIVRFLILPLLQLLEILIGGTCNRSFERMSQDVSRLKVLSIACLLEHEIVRKMLAIVTNVQAGDEDIDGTAAVVLCQPEDAELAQLFARWRLRRAWI